MNTAAEIKDVDPASARHHRWQELPAEQLKGGLSRKLITSERMMIAPCVFGQGRRSAAPFA